MNQPHLQERPPEEERKPSLWRRYRSSKRAKNWTYILMLVIPIMLLLVSMITVFTRAPFNPKGSLPRSTPQGGNRPPNLDEMAQQVLTDMNEHGWDTQYQTMLINWRKSDLSQVNCGPGHCDTRGHSTRQDETNDFRDLQSLYWYQSLHPGDSEMNRYIARILPTVQREWGNTTLNKGWVYFTLLQMKKYSPDPAYWDHTIQHWAEAQYHHIDPLVGVEHGPVATTAGSDAKMLLDGYRVDHALERGLALVDAGVRYHQPEWIQAGQRNVAVVIRQSYSKQFHLFGRIYVFHYGPSDANQLLDTQARMGETGQELEALIRTGVDTKNASYLALAREIIDALQTSPLRDTVYGGFHFKLYVGPYQGKEAGYVDTSIKEARQLHTLIAIHLANRVFDHRWADLEMGMLKMMEQRLFLPAPVPGFTYRVLSDGHMYPCPKCRAPYFEDWVTSEADNIALDAMQTVISD